MRYMLVDGHGNFGSVDGDPPAAYRIRRPVCPRSPTRCSGISKRTPWTGTPTSTRPGKEPRVLPCPVPQPAGKRLLRHRRGHGHQHPAPQPAGGHRRLHLRAGRPGRHSGDLMEHIKGPDFPTKGIIMGRSGIRAAYATGRGRLVVRRGMSLRSSARTVPASSSRSCPIRSTSVCSSRTSPSRWRTSGWRASPTSGRVRPQRYAHRH